MNYWFNQEHGLLIKSRKMHYWWSRETWFSDKARSLILHKIKQEANIAIEEKRSTKEIGSSLEAEIEIQTNDANYKLLEKLDLTEYFITSKAKLIKNLSNQKEIIIKVKKTNGEKCPRCWKILETKCVRCAEFL